MKKVLLLLVSVLGLSLALSAQEWKVNVGQQTPYFEVFGKDSEKITPESLKGKVVLINFFATWCPPCRQELPRLQEEIYLPHKNRNDFQVLVLAREEGWNKIDPFMEDNKYTFPAFPDLKRGVFGLFAEQSIPRNVVLDRTGKIIYQSIGYQAEEFTKMVELINAELEK